MFLFVCFPGPLRKQLQDTKKEEDLGEAPAWEDKALALWDEGGKKRVVQAKTSRDGPGAGSGV